MVKSPRKTLWKNLLPIQMLELGERIVRLGEPLEDTSTLKGRVGRYFEDLE